MKIYILGTHHFVLLYPTLGALPTHDTSMCLIFTVLLRQEHI